METNLQTTEARRAYLRTELLFCSGGCSFDESNSSLCPSHVIRNESPEQRLAWIANASEEAILNLHTYCELCCEDKLKAGKK